MLLGALRGTGAEVGSKKVAQSKERVEINNNRMRGGGKIGVGTLGLLYFDLVGAQKKFWGGACRGAKASSSSRPSMTKRSKSLNPRSYGTTGN